MVQTKRRSSRMVGGRFSAYNIPSEIDVVELSGEFESYLEALAVRMPLRRRAIRINGMGRRQLQPISASCTQKE